MKLRQAKKIVRDVYICYRVGRVPAWHPLHRMDKAFCVVRRHERRLEYEI